MNITAIARRSPETIVRVAQTLTRQGAHIYKITITPKDEKQIMDITIQPTQNIDHILKQIAKLYDVFSVTLKDSSHDLTLD